MNQDQRMNEEQFEYFSALIYKQTGITLTEVKKPMLQARLLRRLRTLKLENFHEYIKYMEKTPTEKTNFINSLTTNKTDFFREIPHFNFLQQNYLPDVVLNNPTGTSISVWSAACSSGPEVYTLGILMNEFISLHPKFDYKIIGTDIDTNILNDAKEGIYPRNMISAIPKKYLEENFVAGTGKNQGLYKVTDNLKKHISFQQFNLIESNSSLPGKFDIIFLRNVLIYFSPEIIQKVIKTISSYLKPDGLLFLGHSENLNNIKHDLSYLEAAIYKKP